MYMPVLPTGVRDLVVAWTAKGIMPLDISSRFSGSRKCRTR